MMPTISALFRARGELQTILPEHDMLIAAADVIDKLTAALRDKFCPRPCGGRPNDFDVGDCVDAGECGCSARTALSLVRQEEKG